MPDMRPIALVLVLFALAGCRLGQLPNPNKVEPASLYDGEALQKSVQLMDQNLTERLVRGEINEATKRTLFHDYVKEKLDGVELSAVPDDQAWRFGDIYRQIQEWETTAALYERAVQNAPDEDRRVNDTLRLAEAKAALGDVPAGIALARSTFDAQPGGKAPILMAVLYEFAPTALGQDHDLEVAQLVEDATHQHLQTLVDPETEAGKKFLEARAHHINRAWELIVRIYRRSDDESAFRGAIERADEMQRRFAQA